MHCPCQTNKSEKKKSPSAAERSSREEKTRFKLKKAAPLEAILPLQRLLSEPVSFPEAPQVDGLAVGQVLPGDINLPRKEKWNAGRLQR